MPPSLFSSLKWFIYREYHPARHWLHCICGCGLNVDCYAAVFYIIGFVLVVAIDLNLVQEILLYFFSKMRPSRWCVIVCIFIDFFFKLLMSLSFVVMNPRVKFIINHYREIYSSNHYPILLQDFGWLVCNFSMFLWKASFIFPTLSTWFISLLGLLWWNRITKPFCP